MPILLVGELNPLSLHPRHALWPAPVNSAGWRLMTKVLGLHRRTYLDTKVIQRVNLCTGSWSTPVAKAEARLVLQQHHNIIALGERVARAFGSGGVELYGTPFHTSSSVEGDEEGHTWTRIVAYLPHPSGRCRTWNDPDSIPAARRLLKRCWPSVPWGEADAPTKED